MVWASSAGARQKFKREFFRVIWWLCRRDLLHELYTTDIKPVQLTLVIIFSSHTRNIL